MALRDEQADILGGPILKRPEYGVFATFSEYHFVFKSVTFLALGLLVWIACARGLERLKRHRELKYRKAMRRKHGIPDSDCRPFAVAYAAAKRAHLEREAQDQRKTNNYVLNHDSPAVDQRTNAQRNACLLRKRVPETTPRVVVQPHDYHLPGEHASVNVIKRPETHALNFADCYNPNPPHRMATSELLPVERDLFRRTSGQELVVNLDGNEESRKRSFEDEGDVGHEAIKKSRIDGDELMDGGGQADWYAQYSDRSSRRASESLGRRLQGDDVHMNAQEMYEHVDDIRNEDHEHEAMEGIVEDDVTAAARGKKRDRAEAGSTFGGDDEEDIRNGKASHHRKRRTIFRGIEVPARGQKRDREAVSPESEGEGVDSETPARHTQRSSKKKKGKKTASDEVGEMSVEDLRISKDPLCGGRRVGDSWEVDGVQYKVGGRGERLRLTLVKKARNKYHMPQDSQHPDRSAALEIYVERWMSEEQYRQAEGRQELAWQEAPGDSSGPKTPSVDSPAKNGKNLLWDSVKCSPARRPFRQLIPPSASARINPFEQWQSQPILGRRVASSSTIISPILPSIADNPTRPGFRGFSKWEKQDREAEAMARIRVKIEEQKKAQALPQKLVEIPTSVTAPELGTKPLCVPTITLTPAPAVATTEAKLDDSTSQSSSKFSFAAPLSTDDPIKSTAVAIVSAPDFSLSSTRIPAAISSTASPSAHTTSPGSLSPFSLVKPPQASSSTSPATLPSTTSNIVSKGTDAGTPSSSAPLRSTIGMTTQPQPPFAGSVSKSVLFPFAKPDTSSPAIIAPPLSKTQGPYFNATSHPSSSPVTFDPTSAATKGDSAVHPLISTTTSGSSKVAAPLFSFPAASSSSSTATLSTPSASVPKFSFGQPSTASTFAPTSNLVSGTVSQSKPTFKFGQPPPDAKDGASAVPIAEESKKSVAQVPTFGTLSGSIARPSSFGVTAGFGTSAFTSPSTSETILFGQSKPTPTLAGVTTVDGTISSTPAQVPLSGNGLVFSSGGTNSGSKSAEGSKSVPLFGGAAEGSSSMTIFGTSSTGSKPAFAFGGSESTFADGRKPSSMSGGHIEISQPPITIGNPAEGSKPVFAIGGSAETPKPTSVFGGAVGSKSTSTFSGVAESKATFGPVTESPKPFINAGSTPTLRSTTFGTLSSTSPFTFGKEDVATDTSTNMNTQTKPATSFIFGAPLGTTGSMSGQPSALTTTGNSNQSVFGKPVNATPSAFGFGGAGASSTFTFGKPAAQNQQQEQ